MHHRFECSVVPFTILSELDGLCGARIVDSMLHFTDSPTNMTKASYLVIQELWYGAPLVDNYGFNHLLGWQPG